MRRLLGVGLASAICFSCAVEVVAQEQTFVLTGNKAISTEELLRLRQPNMTAGELATAVQEYYRKKGYILARARSDGNTSDGNTIVIEEGFITGYEVSGNQRTDREFVWQRVWGDFTKPFNVLELGERIQLARNTPPFSEVKANIRFSEDGSATAKLLIEVQEQQQFSIAGSISNSVPLTIGSEKISATVAVNDIATVGDNLTLAYNTTRTFGLNQFSIAYTVPVGRDETVTISFSPTTFRVTQPEFEALGIRGSSESYSLFYTNKLERTLSNETTLTLGFTRRVGQTFIFDNIAVPFSIGVDADGSTRTNNLTVGLNQLLRDTSGAWQWGATLTLGTGLFGGTYNSTPNSSFTYISTNAQRLQVFNPNLLGVFKFNGQFSFNPLFSSEQFSMGGSGSLRGYRPSMRSADSGVVFNNELRFVLDRQWQVYPFLDFGAVWNNPANPNLLATKQNFLVGTGVGVLFEPSSGVNFNLELALPLTSTVDRTTALQDFALHFGLNYRF